MPTIVHLAPVGAGKTEYALNRLLEFIHNRDQPFLKTWVLLATQRQEVTFRQRLVELQSASTVFFNVEFFNFYQLNARLLNIAGKPPRKIQSSARISIIRMIVATMLQNGELSYFAEIAHTPGFVAVLADLIDELKQNRVEPEIFEKGARTEKDIEISKIYQRYQDTLRSNILVDLEGEGWLALATLQDQAELVDDVDLLLVDGYDQFTPVQAQLVAELSRTIAHVDITLTTVPDRGEDYAKRFVRARTRLQDAHDEAGVPFDFQDLERANILRHRDLDLLGQLIFQNSADHDTSDAIQLIEMPTPVDEVMAVLRRVKQQLFNGVRPDDILVALRDWGRYEAYFESYQGLYDLPLLLHHRTSYAKTPVIAVLIDVLELAPDFRRRDLLDVLRSPYINSGITPEQVDALDRITLAKNMVRGTVADWLQMIEFASVPSFDEDEQQQAPLLSSEEANELSIVVETFLSGITPPDYRDVESYVDWLDRLIGRDPYQDPDNMDDIDTWYDEATFSLNIASQIYVDDSPNDGILRRDITAVNGMKNILRHMLTTDLFLRSTLNQDSDINWDIFWADLQLALDSTVDTPANPSRSGRILVTTAADSRGLPHDHVYILGMAEGVFPAEVSEDPLYLDSERERLQIDSILLETQAERIDDQGLFYELISLPRKTLTLSRPTVQDGKRWIESHLWRAVKNVFGDLSIQRMTIGDVTDPKVAASHDELLLAVANQLNESDADKIEDSLKILNWLVSDDQLSAKWAHILHGRLVEHSRLSNDLFDTYSGYLLHPELQDEVAKKLGSSRVWSASQLKDYGLCGFRFYAKRLLKLNEIGEPEEGYDVLQLGLLNHKILEETYDQLKEDDVPISSDPDDKKFALQTLEAIANEWFDKAPHEFGFRESPMWESEKQVILNRLKALITIDFSADSPLNAFGDERELYEQELAFPDKDNNIPFVDIKLADDLDPIRVRGLIDRIDRVGDKLLVVDYKTGSRSINTSEMEDGRDFQMMIYVLALMAILEKTDSDLEVAGGMFWHLRSLKSSGVFDVGNREDIQSIDIAKGHIANNLRAGREGKFAVHANHIEEGKCVRYCEFSHLCRMSVTNPYK